MKLCALTVHSIFFIFFILFSILAPALPLVWNLNKNVQLCLSYFFTADGSHCLRRDAYDQSALWNKPLKAGGVVGESRWHWRLRSHRWGGLPCEWAEERKQYWDESETVVEENSAAVTVTLRVGANRLVPHHWPHSWFLFEVKERDSRGFYLCLLRG